ncbi:MAG: thioredoxin fold domain-containing protein [Nitrospinae bacterium]|nr:thioredoxin fold domain-containing protein [Nitrospinota bacterium]
MTPGVFTVGGLFIPQGVRRFVALALFLLVVLPGPGFAADPYATGVFKLHFGSMPEELGIANSEGSTLMVYFWQEGCPYCERMEKEVLSAPEIKKTLSEKFHPMEVNIFGSKEMGDFAGKPFTEKSFAGQMKVIYTPTVVFFDKEGRETFRLPGFWQAPHFKAAMVYAREGHYGKMSFQEFLRYHWFKPETKEGAE